MRARVTRDGTKCAKNSTFNGYGGLYFSKTPFEGLIFGGAYFPRGLSTEGNLRFKIDWVGFTVGSNLPFLLCFILYLKEIFLEPCA